MKNRQVVSVITVVRNAENLIERTIKSVLEQTYDNIEYLIIDGASTDATIQIVKKYKSKIDFFLSEPDKSIFDAMNKGLKNATGDYVHFLNAGDTFFDKESLFKLMSVSFGADFLYGRTIFVDIHGQRRLYSKQTPYPKELSDRSFLNGMVISHQAMVVKRDIAQKYEVEKLKVSNDIDWSIRVLKNAQSTCFLDEPFCLFLDEGYSKKLSRRLYGMYERFKIGWHYFGFFPTFIEQFRIFYQYFRYPKKYCE